MKTLRLFYLLFASLLFVQASDAQCLPNGIIFDAQSEVDSFPINYPGCSTILGDVNLLHVSNADSLLQVVHIDGILSFGDSLTSVAGLQNLVSCKGINTVAEIVEGTLLNLKILDGNLSITSSNSTSGMSISTNWLENVEIINGNISRFAWNTSNSIRLKNLTRLNGVLEIGEHGVSAFMPKLEYVEGMYFSTAYFGTAGFPNLTHVGEAGISCLSGSEINLGGLTKLTRIDGVLAIESGAIVKGIDSLKNLTILGSFIKRFDASNDIKDLNFLSNLDSLKVLSLESTSIQDISGLEKVKGLEKVVIKKCGLGQCSIAPICALAIKDGDIVLGSNIMGCNSKQEILDACVVPIISYSDPLDIRIAPNPVADMIFIDGVEKVDNVLIYNSLGRLMLRSEDSILDVSNFEHGVYFVQVNAVGRIWVRKILVE